ncbi:hypothetical protein [Roseobacter litoralis]|uniref:Outer membrane protein beta-barrel domain-containing protein n=1 Tax=Roseobacter litoralis (strain ATCC 49566 / DSM 6996 / JCM 21268 / NBRC 15278 / OCh 149) TaxID=391595 RepID=F7ZAC7_ROSLO|nr:hypothetical protein [Roseobacter litoralis]AEI95474.1 hypothetical protein RLO149_c035350 [Roseobacter litoralis Och 149]
MRSVVFALILALVSASSAQAGAWLREKGKSFVSTSVQTTENNGSSVSFYMEYGLGEKVTIGADITYDTEILNYVAGADIAATTIEDVPIGSGILFARFPLGPVDQPNKWAFHLGIGARYFEAEFLQAAELGLSWGRGIQIGSKYGWVNVDSSYNDAEAPAEARIKVDGTVGLGLTDKTKVMLQMFNTFEDGQSFSKLSPSLLFSPGKGRVTFQFSSEIPTKGGEASLKLGVWTEF